MSDVSGIPPLDAARAPVSAADARARRFAAWIVIPLLLLFVAIILVFYVVFDVSRVVGTSMLPNLRPEDGLLLTKGYTAPRRGDIVVIRIPAQFGGTEEVVKRVVAVPGDTVEVRDDVAYVNGVKESGYQVILDPPGTGDNRSARTLKPGELYIMGDNRPVSFDSRYVGPQQTSAVRGRAVGIFMPITRLRRIARLPARPTSAP